jgi:protein TonB
LFIFETTIYTEYMKLLLLSFLLTATSALFAQDVPPPPMPPSPPDTILTYVEQPAEFPGGQVAMFKFIQDNIRFPESASEAKISGKCYLKFVVTKAGVVEQVKVVRGVSGCPECDREAIRVLKSMPRWRPGITQGKAVHSYYTLPFAFVAH